jgi:PTH1 family peptidyl-tRNA hydrolase
MRLVVGLGNPGPKYERNRHNIGFMAVDEIVRRHGFGAWRSRFQGLTSDGAIGGDKVLVLKPATFMNDSGRSVGEAARFFKLAPSDVIVIYDELDLARTKVKVKQGGGNGGHNGLRSIDAHLGADYWRVRIGIGHPGEKSKVTGHVLSDFSKAEWPDFERLIQGISDRIDLLVSGKPSDFMSKLAMDLSPPPTKPRKTDATEGAGEPDAAPTGRNAKPDAGLAGQLSRWLSGKDKT